MLLSQLKKHIGCLFLLVIWSLPVFSLDSIPSPQAFKPLLLSVYINEHESDNVVLFIQDRDQHIWAQAEDLKKWNFKAKKKCFL